MAARSRSGSRVLLNPRRPTIVLESSMGLIGWKLSQIASLIGAHLFRNAAIGSTPAARRAGWLRPAAQPILASAQPTRA